MKIKREDGMEEKRVLAEILKETAVTLKKEKQESLSKTLLRGKICKEIREKLNCYKEFKLWSFETGFSIATLNRDINRYELYELMQEEAGKAKVEELSAVLLAWIGKLQRCNEEKFLELVVYIDQGLDNKGIKMFLEENITEESTQLKGEELREYFRELEKEVRSIDIRSMKHNTGKKIIKAIDRVFKLVCGCTKLNKARKNKELSREIKEINYGIGVLNIS